MSQYLSPVRRALVASRTASPIATTSAYTLSGYVRRPMSMSTTAFQPAPTSPNSATVEQPVAPSPESLRPTTHFRVTLRRSAIGLPEKTSKILKTMGFKRRLQSVFLRHDGPMSGMILAVKDLVHVDNVRRLDPPAGMFDDAPSSVDAAGAVEEWHSSINDEDAIWVDAQGDVVDWGREARRAPRGYTVIGNLISEERDEQIRAVNAARAPAETL